MNAALEFYCDFLGFTEYCRLNDLGTGELMLVLFKISPTQWVEVFSGGTEKPKKFHQIAFKVESAEAVRLMLAARKVEVPSTTFRGQMRNVGLIIPDPARHDLEFVEYHNEGWTQQNRDGSLPENRIAQSINKIVVQGNRNDSLSRYYQNVIGLSLSPATENGMAIFNTAHLCESLLMDSSDQYVPCMVFGVENLEHAKAKLSSKGFCQKYGQTIEIDNSPEGHRFIKLTDPDGISITLEQNN